MGTHTLQFRAINRDTFLAIRRGTKMIETRAATERYRNILKGDALIFVCGKTKFKKQVKRARKFSSISALLRAYKPRQINPKVKSAEELRVMYASFPGYREKIRKFGIIALEL